MPDTLEITRVLKAFNEIKDRRSALDFFGEAVPDSEVLETIIKERDSNGPFASLNDIRKRIGEMADSVLRIGTLSDSETDAPDASDSEVDDSEPSPRRAPRGVSSFKFTKMMGSPEISLGALYLVDLYERARRGGPLNPVEAVVMREAQREYLLPNEDLLGALASAIPESHVAILSREPEAVPFLNRVLGTGFPLAGTRDIATLNISEEATEGLLLLGEADTGVDSPKEPEFPKTMGGWFDLTGRAFAVVGTGIDTVNRFRKKKDKKTPGGTSTPKPGAPTTEIPPNPDKKLSEPGLTGLMLTEKGYRIAIDQIICHEEQERWSRDDLYFVWESKILLTSGSSGTVLTARGGSNQILKMNGRDESGRIQDPYRAQHPNAAVDDHVYSLADKEAYLMFQKDGTVFPIPRSLFKQANITFAAYNEDLVTGDTLKKIVDLIAGAVVIAGIYQKGSAADFDKTAKATEKFVSAIKKFLNEDDEIVLHDFKVFKSDFEQDFKPLTDKKMPLPTSYVPWLLRTGHRRIKDTEALGKGPVFHGYRNPFFNDTQTGDFFRFSSQKGKALTDEELDKVAKSKGRSAIYKIDQAGGFWTEFRIRLEKTR